MSTMSTMYCDLIIKCCQYSVSSKKHITDLIMGCEWQRQHIHGLKATQMIFCNHLSSLVPLFGYLEWQNGFIEPVHFRCSRFQLGSTSKQTCC